jgi:phage tail protein X
MSATPSQKTAAISKPAAAPAGSLPGEEKPTKVAPAAAADTGTDAESVTESDVLLALGQRSDGPKTGDEAEEAEAEAKPEGDKPEGEAAAAEAEAETPGESKEEAAPSGDDAAGASGDVETTPKDEGGEAPAGGEKPADGAAKPPVQRRIDELTARVKEAEASLAQANERLASFDADNAGRFDAGALEHIDSLDALARQRHEIVALHQKLLRAPQGIELPDPKEKGKTVQYDADGVADLLGQTFALLHDSIPAREQFLRARETHDAAAVNAYPWLKDSRQGPGAQVQAVIQANPGLRHVGPNYRLVAADALIGQTLREAGIAVTPQLVARLKGEGQSAKSQGAKGPGAGAAPSTIRKQPPASPARPGVLPARGTTRDAQGGSADRKMRRGDGNINDVAASIAARL